MGPLLQFHKRWNASHHSNPSGVVSDIAVKSTPPYPERIDGSRSNTNLNDTVGTNCPSGIWRKKRRRGGPPLSSTQEESSSIPVIVTSSSSSSSSPNDGGEQQKQQHPVQPFDGSAVTTTTAAPPVTDGAPAGIFLDGKKRSQQQNHKQQHHQQPSVGIWIKRAFSRHQQSQSSTTTTTFGNEHRHEHDKGSTILLSPSSSASSSHFSRKMDPSTSSKKHSKGNCTQPAPATAVTTTTKVGLDQKVDHRHQKTIHDDNGKILDSTPFAYRSDQNTKLLIQTSDTNKVEYFRIHDAVINQNERNLDNVQHHRLVGGMSGRPPKNDHVIQRDVVFVDVPKNSEVVRHHDEDRRKIHHDEIFLPQNNDDSNYDDNHDEQTEQTIPESLDKSYIISKLFPLGHPDKRRGEDKEKGGTKLNEQQIHQLRKIMKGPSQFEVGRMVLHGSFDDESNESPLQQEMLTIDTSESSGGGVGGDGDGVLDSLIISDGGLDRMMSSTLQTSVNGDDDPIDNAVSNATSTSHHCVQRQKAVKEHADRTEQPVAELSPIATKNGIIGMIISFDPTWELLSLEGQQQQQPILSASSSPSRFVKSKLKKLQEIENYVDSLLGRYDHKDEESEKSVDLLANLDLSFDLNETDDDDNDNENGAPSGAKDNSTTSGKIDTVDTQRNTQGNKHNRQQVSAPRRGDDYRITTPTTSSAAEVSFVLGFHFDHTRFPPVIVDDMDDTTTTEIVFDYDDIIGDDGSMDTTQSDGLLAGESVAKCGSGIDGVDFYGCQSNHILDGDTMSSRLAASVDDDKDNLESKINDSPGVILALSSLPVQWLLPLSPVSCTDWMEGVMGGGAFVDDDDDLLFGPFIPTSTDSTTATPIPTTKEEKLLTLSGASSKRTHTTVSSCSFSLFEDVVLDCPYQNVGFNDSHHRENDNDDDDNDDDDAFGNEGNDTVAMDHLLDFSSNNNSYDDIGGVVPKKLFL